MDKPTEIEVDKSNDEHEEAISMVDITIQKDTSTIPTMSTLNPTIATTTVDPTQAITTPEISISTTNISSPPITEDSPEPGL